MPYDEALTYAIALAVSIAVTGIGGNHFYKMGNHISLKMRVAVCNLIYKKSLRLSQTALCGTSPGQLVNLLSNDVSRFDVCAVLLNAVWGAPLITSIAAIMLWKESGWAGMVGFIIIFIVVPIMSECWSGPRQPLWLAANVSMIQ